MGRPVGLLAVVVFGTLIAACTGDSTPEASSTAVTTTSPSTTMPVSTTVVAEGGVSTTLAPVSYPGGATHVTGRITKFAIDQGTITTNSDGSSHSRDGTITYTLTSNDPRAAGTVTGTWNSDRWGRPPDVALIQWGEAIITNENGTWEAAYDGIFTSPLGDVLTRWWQGGGNYQGLTFYMAATGQSNWEWVGLIYPGTPPPNN